MLMESLVTASFAAFVTCHTLLALLIACAFPLGRWAMIIAFGLYFILPMCDETAGWDIINKYALNLDNVTIGEMFIILLATAFILAISIAYLSNVLPWTTSRPQHLLFPVMPSYWFPRTLTVKATAVKESDNAEHFEALPKLKVVIECKNLVKVYGGTVALNNVNMTTYKSQVTILLGHNGAGKTTLMSILTGLIEPNGGSVLVSGKNIRTAGFERMGFCPQFDAFFADLTVSEHLKYYGGMKGLESHLLPKITKQLLKSVRLSDKANAFPHELSGGMKRKLSIALALLTTPEVLILDEPTVGLDPETRRTIWSLVKELRGKASILLSTHDMEEADVLGDRIIVMYSGSVICWGSPSFLKKACGTFRTQQ
ncbi:hypothetical protein MTO96_001825 [Rhipicephalus appendiculatus]